MDHPHEPIEAINDWQIWYRNNNMKKESVYKNPNWKSFWDKQPNTDMPSSDNSIFFNKAVEHFSDTLAEYSYELTGNEFYLAFLKAAEQIAEHAKTEYNKTKELVELLKSNEKK